MLFLREVPSKRAHETTDVGARLRNRIAHLRQNSLVPLPAVLAIVPDGSSVGLSGQDVVEASEVVFGTIPGQKYDAVVCVDVLDRVDDPGALLDRLHALLPYGAPLSVTVRSVDSTAARHARAAWRGFRTGAARFYGVDSLQSTLIRHGFRDARTYVDGVIHPGSLRLRSAARLAAATRLGGAAVRVQERAGFIDESITLVCLRAEPIERYRLSVIVPVYNEARTFSELMSRLLAKTIDGVDIDVTVIESNSSDGSRAEVLRYDSHPRVSIILQDRPRGKGNAVRAGLAKAKGDIILFQDADLEYEIEDYEDLIRPIISHHRNFVIGSRHGRQGNAWKIRDFNGAPVLSQVFNAGHVLFLTLLNALYGQSLSDPFSMFKVFRRDCLAGLIFECNRFDFDFEIVIKLLRKGYRPLEIPVNYHSRSIAEGKKVTMVRDPLTWLRALARFRKSALYATGPRPDGTR
jgi:hypothetical protein